MVAGAALVGAAIPASADPFEREQGRATRVVQARREVNSEVRALFAKAGVTYPARQLLIRVFKEEGELEVWGGGRRGALTLLQRYPICAKSGTLGPKRQQGDLQVPEGFYTINIFNPYSVFHLSLGINYPNASDRILGGRGDLGGDIMIHGDCVTIGCVPIEDEKIKQLYVMALDTHLATGRGPVHVHIFPRRLDEDGMRLLQAQAGDDKPLWAFWTSLQPGFLAFERSHVVPRMTVDRNSGYYRIDGGS